MELKTQEVVVRGVKVSCHIEGREIAHAYLYLLKNDLHEEPFCMVEDVFVVPEYRRHGIAKQFAGDVIGIARAAGCYKIVGTSRFVRSELHAWYHRLGFKRCGFEFRLDLFHPSRNK